MARQLYVKVAEEFKHFMLFFISDVDEKVKERDSTDLVKNEKSMFYLIGPDGYEDAKEIPGMED